MIAALVIDQLGGYRVLFAFAGMFTFLGAMSVYRIKSITVAAGGLRGCVRPVQAGPAGQRRRAVSRSRCDSFSGLRTE